jgi:endonuclease III
VIGSERASLPQLLHRLREFYGPLPLPPKDPFAVYVWDVLGDHTTPHKRDAALAALKRIPALTPDSIWKTPLGKLEAAVSLAGPYQDDRIRSLRAGAELFRREPQLAQALTGRLLAARRRVDRLAALSPVGRQRLLLFAGDHAIVPVDGSLARLVTRLGLAEPVAGRLRLRPIRRTLTRLLPADLDERRRAVLLLDHHAVSTCAEHDPHCHVCPLAGSCPSAVRS